jgi:hypothetical protein
MAVKTFQVSTEYDRQAADARRRRRMADLLAQQVIEPTQFGPGPTPAGAPLVQGLQAFLAARAGRKADEAEETALATKTRAEREAEQQVAATGSQIAGRLMGGAPVREIAPPDASGLGEVAIESRYRKDPEGAMAIGMTQRGGEAISKAPLLASMLANQMKEPKEKKAPATVGGMMFDETSGKFVPIEGYAEQQEQIARAKRPDVVVAGGGGMPKPLKAPSGYRYTATGELEPIPGGPQDPSRDRTLPATIVTQIAQERRNAGQIEQTLNRTQSFINMIERGELPLNKASRFEYGAKRMLDTQLGREGDSTQPYVRYYELERFVNQQVNRILNLAKGPQTEGDAIRARQQILDNPDNQKVVLSALKDLERIWKDEVELSNAAVQDLTSPYAGQSVVAPAAPAAPKKTKRRTASGIEYEVEE